MTIRELKEKLNEYKDDELTNVYIITDEDNENEKCFHIKEIKLTKGEYNLKYIDIICEKM